MRRAEFEHVVRAAASILGVREILVIGSQAIHASTSDPLPLAVVRSMEADVADLGSAPEEAADLIDGSIGELSMFHATFGYYAQGVAPSTAVLPDGWRDRLVRFDTPATSGVVAWCLEPHDLWISKALAHRPKDIEFCGELKRAGLVDSQVLEERLAAVPDLEEVQRSAVLEVIGVDG